ncbi:protein-glutamine glutaminase family protein [Bdellovibrio sp. HCB288]|uniref:protein-glutamine glutaminase family protein n=1 Tax=Bdellovibrio sp. HCB288 TaxID=3394355 RepID=UPI0039B4EE52
MSQIAESDNIQMGKVWVEGMLRAKAKTKSIADIEWGYHVTIKYDISTRDILKMEAR